MWKKAHGFFEHVEWKVEIVVEKFLQIPVHMQQVGDMCPQNVVDYQEFEQAHAFVHEKVRERVHEMFEQKVEVEEKKYEAHQCVEQK